jgi:hypothetical protein
LNIYDSQTNFQQLHDGFDLQDRPFHQGVMVMELISDDLQGFVDSYSSENINSIKANEGYLKIEDLQTSITVRSGPNTLRRIPIFPHEDSVSYGENEPGQSKENRQNSQ